MTGAFFEALEAVVGAGAVQAAAPLAPLTTFGVGGPADWLVDVHSERELSGVVRLCQSAGVPFWVLGGGSNVLVADAGVRGVVARVRVAEVELALDGLVRAGAALTMNGLVRWSIGRGLAGLESWAGTPGTVGGAVYGNAHFAGRNIGDEIAAVRVVDREGVGRTVPAGEMEFRYDHSRLSRTAEVVVWASFRVTRGDPARLRERARASLSLRKRTQPLALPSAGCIFQNPDPARDTVPDSLPWSAGALVDRAGLKGRRVGGAAISTVHGNFIVNDGHATAADIHALKELARRDVRQQFGVTLRDEIVTIGQFEGGEA